MKRYILPILFLLIIASASALEIPKYTNYVTDNANIVDAATEAELNAMIADIEKNTTAEIAILTIPSLEGEALEDYSLKVAESWGVGKKQNDNGLLILVAVNDRKIRMEVGYGLEGTIPDITARRITDNTITPEFRKGDYGEGLKQGIIAIRGFLEKDPTVIARYEDKPISTNTIYTLLMIIGVIIVASILGRLFAAAKGFFFFIALVSDVVLFTLWIIPLTVILGMIMLFIIFAIFNTTKKGSGYWFPGYGGFGGGFSGGSSFGGNFGGFGGGSFGGGGFSGSW